MKRVLGKSTALFAAGTALFGQTPTITGVSNSGSGATTVESGSWVSIYGTGLGLTTRFLADLRHSGQRASNRPR
ncbi:MAG: hypothetical protein WDO73_04355 [Ignavibacteriota bacterium]